mgnify:FL=1
MSEQKIHNVIEKSEMYKKSEDIILDKIMNVFDRIDNCYVTTNTEKLDNVHLELKNKGVKVKKIHQNDITVLQKNLKKYQDTKGKIENLFRSI